MVHILIRNGFDIDAYVRSVKGSSLLVLTIRRGKSHMVRCLLDLGCDVNEIEYGALPLKHALDEWTKRNYHNDYLKVVLLLIKRIAVLLAANAQIHPGNWEMIRSTRKMVDAFQAFRRELNVMRVTRVVVNARDSCSNVTYLDVLAMPKSELARIVGSCKRIEKILNLGDYKRMFASYDEELEASYENALQFLSRRAR